MDINTKNKNFVEAREKLPESLRPIFDQLVESYKLRSTQIYGHPWAAYRVLAALVKDGWRLEEGGQEFVPLDKPS